MPGFRRGRAGRPPDLPPCLESDRVAARLPTAAGHAATRLCRTLRVGESDPDPDRGAARITAAGHAATRLCRTLRVGEPDPDRGAARITAAGHAAHACAAPSTWGNQSRTWPRRPAARPPGSAPREGGAADAGIPPRACRARPRYTALSRVRSRRRTDANCCGARCDTLVPHPPRGGISLALGHGALPRAPQAPLRGRVGPLTLAVAAGWVGGFAATHCGAQHKFFQPPHVQTPVGFRADFPRTHHVEPQARRTTLVTGVGTQCTYLHTCEPVCLPLR